MNYSKLLLLNIINLVIFALVLFLYKFMALPIIIILVVFWFIFVCVSNYTILNNSKINLNEKLDKAGRGLFDEEINRTKQALKSVDARAHIFEDIENENLKEIYEKLKKQIYTNADYITKYIDAYDYVMKPVSQKDKIKDLIKQNEMLINKLNILVEQMISVDKSVNDLDTTYVDDIIDALKTVSQTEVLENKYI